MANNRLAISFKDRNLGTYDRQIDKITHSELNTLLNEKIDTSFVHVSDEVRHITAEERNRWNNILSKLKPATKTENGLFSAKDKAKLDSISEGASKYTHPVSGVNPGSYTRVTVSDQGHVMYGDNPTRLDITVSNSERFGEQLPSYYAKVNNPTFTGTVKVPAVTINSNPKSPVTVELLESYVRDQLNKAWPIGSIFISAVDTNPSTLIGGQWRRIAEGRCLFGVGGNDITLRKTGGTSEVRLQGHQMPSHTHSFSANGRTNNHDGHDHASSSNGYKLGWPWFDQNVNKPEIRIMASDDWTSDFGTAWGHQESRTSRNGNHYHDFSVSGSTSATGSGSPINIMPPYFGVYMWERIG